MRTVSFLLMDIPFSVTDQTLESLLTPYGEVRELWYPKDSLGVPFGYAFVTLTVAPMTKSLPSYLKGVGGQSDESISVFGEHTLIYQILARNRWPPPSADQTSGEPVKPSGKHEIQHVTKGPRGNGPISRPFQKRGSSNV